MERERRQVLARQAILSFVFEQQPLREGKQLLHCLFDLTHTQFRHLPPALQRQQRDMVYHEAISACCYTAFSDCRTVHQISLHSDIESVFDLQPARHVSFVNTLCNFVPTPCLNAFWHSDPYIFLHFVGNVFLSCFCEFLGGHLSSLMTDNSAQPLPTENSGCFRLASADCGVNNRGSRLPARRPTEKSGAGDRLSSFPGRKPEDEVTWQCHVVATFAHAHNYLKWRPTSRQVLECLDFRLMRTDEVREILRYRGPSR